MAITVPELYDTRDFECNFPDLVDLDIRYVVGFTKFTKDNLENFFTKKYGLPWSIILSYLFPPKDLIDFRIRFSKLLGNENHAGCLEAGKIEELYDFLLKYNPFRNRYSCFYNETLKTLVRDFDRNVHGVLHDKAFKRDFKKQEKNLKKDKFLNSYVQAACFLLKNNILLYDIQQKTANVFVSSPSRSLPTGSSLTLYVNYEKDNESNKIFSYGIDQEFGNVLQTDALKSILASAGVFPRKIHFVSRSLSPGNNIILTLVSINMYEIISILFKKPHSLLKLEEAGYNVNPSVRDANGKTALYYAIDAKKENVVHQYYNYLSGTLQFTGVSLRNPKQSILQNLERLRPILDEHKSKFKESKSKASITFLDQLTKFSCFQTTIITKLLQAEDDLPLPYEQAEAEKKKRKLLAVLSTYADYFDFEDKRNNCSGDWDTEAFINLHRSFKNYKRYYQIIDFNAALFFFDNLFSLKQNLILNDSVYERMESNFLRFLLICSFYNFSNCSPSNKAFSKMRECRQKLISTIPRSRSCRIVYMERSKLSANLREFSDLLASTQVQDDNIVLSLPESEVETLISLPEIRDILMFRTIVHYLDMVSEIEFSYLSPESDTEMQAVLIIERALQVLGEHLNERSTEPVSMGKSLLVSILPADVRSNLRDIRDALSHIDGKKVKCRRNVEKCRETFEGIISELSIIRLQVKGSHRLLELLARKYMLSIGRSCLKEIHKKHKKSKISMRVGMTQEIVLVLQSIRKEHQLLSSAVNGMRKKIRSFSLHCNLQTHFQYVNFYMFENKTVSKSVRLLKVLFHLKCVEILFIHVFKEVKRNPWDEKHLKDVINQLTNLAKANFSDKQTNEDRIPEQIKEKEEYLITKYDEIFRKSALHKPKKCGKIKNKDVSKKSLSCCISKHNLQDFYYEHPDNASLLGTNSSFCKRSSSTSEEADSDSENVEECSDYPYIKNLRKSLHDVYPLNEDEKRYIMERVPLHFKQHSSGRRELLKLFEAKCEQGDEKIMKSKSIEEIKEHIQKLLPSSNKRELEKCASDENLRKTNFDIIKGIKDYCGDLFQNLNNNEMICRSDYKQYCSYELQMISDEKSKELLKKCVKGEPFKADNDAILKYLRDKIVTLEYLLLKSDPAIGKIWPKIKSSETRQHAIYRIKERYVRDFNLQAAVEMLLFDCMNVTYRKDLKKLWKKASNLFNGINMRNVLAHGNPLFEEVGKILDPDDFPSEIITKCLELVDDRPTIEAMCKLLDKIGGTRRNFIDAVRNKVDFSCLDIYETIARSIRWEGYASLIR